MQSDSARLPGECPQREGGLPGSRERCYLLLLAAVITLAKAVPLPFVIPGWPQLSCASRQERKEKWQGHSVRLYIDTDEHE